MELPKILKSERGGMLDGIKSKLGFADAGHDYDDGYYEQGGDEYGDAYSDEYAEYGSDYHADGALDAPATGSKYEPRTPVSLRSARQTARSAGVTPPKLVSIDDVRARTQVPDSLNRDPLPPRRVTPVPGGGYRGDRTVVDVLSSAAPGTPNARAAAQQDRERSESLNALFSPTASYDAPAAAPVSGSPSQPAHAATSGMSGAASVMTGSFDPYDAYAGAGTAKHSPSRAITLLKPANYGEVERIAKALKAGDAVVLALRNTPDSLAKRILDFSFGVSSALDANVDCISAKVFAITRGAVLTDAERASLRSQGVL